MKVTTRWKGLLSFLLLFTVVMNACKKDKPAKVFPELFGSWTEDLPFDSSKKVPRGLMFIRDSVYFSIWDHKSGQVTYVKGTYRTEEDKLITNFKEIELRQDNDRVISRTPVNDNYFNNATYQVSEYKLILNYTGNPSNGTTPATITFNRVFPD